MQQEKLAINQIRLGFSSGGAISSRTVMQDEFSVLLSAVPINAASDDYKLAILEQNVLEKATASNRLKTYKYLRSLYALDPDVCLFREMRRLMQYVGTDAKLLMGLLSMAREPMLRECLIMVLHTSVGKSLGRPEFESWIRAHAPGRFSESMFVSFSHNLYASFYQFGYLGESIGKARTRVRPVSGIASATFAAFLDWLEGRSGIALLQGTYSRALDIPADEHLALLQSAGRQGLMKVAYSGSVLELAFPGFIKKLRLKNQWVTTALKNKISI